MFSDFIVVFEDYELGMEQNDREVTDDADDVLTLEVKDEVSFCSEQLGERNVTKV